MKEIPNIQFSLPVAGTSEFATTAKLIELVLNQPPEEGFSFQLMRQRNRVADAVANVEIGGIIKLEDSDFETAKRAVGSYRWAFRHPDVLKFAEQFGL